MLSLVITTFNRTSLLFESFAQVLDDPRITDVCIVDDCSSAHTIIEINRLLSELPAHREKIRFFMNDRNLGCYRNKREAVSKAINEWVVLLDSDNRLDKGYIKAITENPVAWNRYLLFQPSFAMPHFDFRRYAGKFVRSDNVAEFVEDPTFTTAMNAANYFVHRDEYLRVWEDCPEPWTSDSLLQNYNWLNAGNSIYFCPGLEYFHRVEDHGNEEESHYKKHNHRTKRGFHEGLIRKLKAMR
jgi:glycosyltransferase involved in cell wall biosynthesis